MGNGESRSFDAIVIGGGPAGAATAISCARRGLRALVVEAGMAPPRRPGETLHPGVEVIFESLGVNPRIRQAGFARHAGHEISRKGVVSFVPYGADERGPWRGFQALREQLDGILIERAIEAGARVLRPARALDPLLDRGRVSGLRTTGGEFASAFVVDASGSSHWLQRRLGIPILEASGPLTARYGWRAAEATLHENDVPRFSFENGGWSWRARVGPTVEAWLSLRLEGRPDGTPENARDVTWRITRPCAGDGYFLAGDAAFVLDPASSHGVLKALMSGMLVASAIAKCKAGSARERDVRAGYCAWMERWFCADARALIELYSEVDPMPSWLDSAREAVRYISSRPSGVNGLQKTPAGVLSHLGIPPEAG